MGLVNYEEKAVWSDDGITFSHKVEGKSLENEAYAIKPEEAEQESMFGFIWPIHIPLMSPGSISLAMFQVLPTGPETTSERWDFYFTSTEPTDLERRFMDYIKTTLVKEDVALCEGVQRGLHSHANWS